MKNLILNNDREEFQQVIDDPLSDPSIIEVLEALLKDAEEVHAWLEAIQQEQKETIP